MVRVVRSGSFYVVCVHCAHIHNEITECWFHNGATSMVKTIVAAVRAKHVVGVGINTPHKFSVAYNMPFC